MSDARSSSHPVPQRAEIVLMAMAAGGRGTLFEPVRIQKLLFLIDREIAGVVGGPHFDFRPYRYGPFDRAVFDELDALSRTGDVEIAAGPDRRVYTLTTAGFGKGAGSLGRLPEAVRAYLHDLAAWVLSLSFGRLLAAVYRRYPEMVGESVVLDVAGRFPEGKPPFPERPLLEGVASVFDLDGSALPASRETGRRTDAAALADDWRTVGDDLRAAMAAFAVGSASRT